MNTELLKGVSNHSEFIRKVREHKKMSRMELKRKYNQKYNKKVSYMTFYRLENKPEIKSRKNFLKDVLQILGVDYKVYKKFLKERIKE